MKSEWTAKQNQCRQFLYSNRGGKGREACLNLFFLIKYRQNDKSKFSQKGEKERSFVTQGKRQNFFAEKNEKIYKDDP